MNFGPTIDADRCRNAERIFIVSTLSALTLDEKIQLLSGESYWSTHAIDRLNIPSLTMGDGPTGLRTANSEPSTAFPVAVALAASWDHELVTQVSGAIAQEAIAAGVDILLAPGINIQRNPLGGRNFEYFAEDPCLTAQIGGAFVTGVQGQGIGCAVKHFAANNQEANRMEVSANISPRPLREIYLASFEQIIKQTNPWLVMAAYNKVNGVHASENSALISDILKSEWKYGGVVVSDWDAVRSTAGAANAGLDLEMPGPATYFGEKLRAAIDQGAVPLSVLDEAVTRILRLVWRCKHGSAAPQTGRTHGPAHRQIARQAASSSIVLLKNEGGILPITDVSRLAVIGALANQPAIQGSGSSQVTPDRVVTPLDGLHNALGESCHIHFERGVDNEPKIPIADTRLFSPTADFSKPGLLVRYFDNDSLDEHCSSVKVERHFSKLGFGAEAQTAQSPEFSSEWTGYFRPRHSGVHIWEVAHSNPEIELEIEEVAHVQTDSPRDHEQLFMALSLHVRQFSLEMEAGKAYRFALRHYQPNQGTFVGFNVLRIGLREPEPSLEAALVAAELADRSVVFVGNGTTTDTEGEDRTTMALSNAQNQLVEEVLDRDPEALIVLNTSGPVEMPWADRAKAIVCMWLPGQECGHAIADVLTGKVNPSGKLPITFPRSYDDNPSAKFYPGKEQVEYGEGLLVGYRHYDARGVEPLFPFGHGLSYTSFSYGNVRAHRHTSESGGFDFRLEIKNCGKLAGAETVQLYVEKMRRHSDEPVRQLRRFHKTFLQPGGLEEISFSLKPCDFSEWNEDASAWQVATGEYRIHIGSSSRDLRSHVDIEVQ